MNMKTGPKKCKMARETSLFKASKYRGKREEWKERPLQHNVTIKALLVAGGRAFMFRKITETLCNLNCCC